MTTTPIPDRTGYNTPEYDSQLIHHFTYHPPTDWQVKSYQAIRDAGLAFARVIATHAPRSADATTAIRTVREAGMWANAAIACALPPPTRQTVGDDLRDRIALMDARDAGISATDVETERDILSDRYLEETVVYRNPDGTTSRGDVSAIHLRNRQPDGDWLLTIRDDRDNFVDRPLGDVELASVVDERDAQDGELLRERDRLMGQWVEYIPDGECDTVPSLPGVVTRVYWWPANTHDIYVTAQPVKGATFTARATSVTVVDPPSDADGTYDELAAKWLGKRIVWQLGRGGVVVGFHRHRIDGLWRAVYEAEDGLCYDAPVAEIELEPDTMSADDGVVDAEIVDIDLDNDPREWPVHYVNVDSSGHWMMEACPKDCPRPTAGETSEPCAVEVALAGEDWVHGFLERHPDGARLRITDGGPPDPGAATFGLLPYSRFAFTPVPTERDKRINSLIDLHLRSDRMGRGLLATWTYALKDATLEASLTDTVKQRLHQQMVRLADDYHMKLIGEGIENGSWRITRAGTDQPDGTVVVLLEQNATTGLTWGSVPELREQCAAIVDELIAAENEPTPLDKLVDAHKASLTPHGAEYGTHLAMPKSVLDFPGMGGDVRTTLNTQLDTAVSADRMVRAGAAVDIGYTVDDADLFIRNLVRFTATCRARTVLTWADDDDLRTQCQAILAAREAPKDITARHKVVPQVTVREGDTIRILEFRDDVYNGYDYLVDAVAERGLGDHTGDPAAWVAVIRTVTHAPVAPAPGAVSRKEAAFGVTPPVDRPLPTATDYARGFMVPPRSDDQVR